MIEELNVTVLFAQFGLRDTIVTDNGTCFVSAEFSAFLQRNGIKQIANICVFVRVHAMPYNICI